MESMAELDAQMKGPGRTEEESSSEDATLSTGRSHVAEAHVILDWSSCATRMDDIGVDVYMQHESIETPSCHAIPKLLLLLLRSDNRDWSDALLQIPSKIQHLAMHEAMEICLSNKEKMLGA
jgi:hypothetical protein